MQKKCLSMGVLAVSGCVYNKPRETSLFPDPLFFFSLFPLCFCLVPTLEPISFELTSVSVGGTCSSNCTSLQFIETILFLSGSTATGNFVSTFSLSSIAPFAPALPQRCFSVFLASDFSARVPIPSAELPMAKTVLLSFSGQELILALRLP